jgi:hypothetical protein
MPAPIQHPIPDILQAGHLGFEDDAAAFVVFSLPALLPASFP